jgi:hypothetical protein
MDFQSSTYAMRHAGTLHRQARGTDAAIAETQVWLQEHDWLMDVMRSDANVAPAFRMPDLISACVTLVLARPHGPAELFAYLSEQLVLRDPHTPRRMAQLWREQFECLRELQRSRANRHPNPRFQLDQLTTACVALVRALPQAAAQVYAQARQNMSARMTAQHGTAPPP